MGFLEGLGQFSQGATGGFQQGLSIYDQMQQIGDKNQERQRQGAAEAEIGELVKSGLAQKDPTEFTKQGSQIWLKHSLFDKYDAWQSQAMKLDDFKANQLEHNIFAVGGTNPLAAIPLMNEWNKLRGTGMNVSAQALPGGGYRIGTGGAGGQAGAKDYNTPQEAHMALMDMIERFSMPAKDYYENKRETFKATAQAANWQSEAQAREAKLPSEIAENWGSAGASRAAAGASGAAAQASLTSADLNRAKTGTELLKDPTIDMERYLTPDATEEGTYESAADPAGMYSLRTAIQNATQSTPQAAFSLAQRLARLPPESLGTMDFNGPVVTLPSGEQIPNTPEFEAEMIRIRRAAGLGEE